MYFEIINPSDPYILEAADHATAAVACFLLGDGHYAFKEVGERDLEVAEKREVPLFFFGGAAKWFEETFSVPFPEFYDNKDNKAKIADCLDSVLLCRNLDEYRGYKARLDAVSGEKRDELRAKTHDKLRSSMNDIGSRAWGMAKLIRAKL